MTSTAEILVRPEEERRYFAWRDKDEECEFCGGTRGKHYPRCPAVETEENDDE